MSKIWNCVKVYFIRNSSNSLGVILTVLILPCVVLLSFYYTHTAKTANVIAVVDSNYELTEYLSTQHIQFELKEFKPLKDEVFMRKYCGLIYKDGDKYKAISYSGEKNQERLNSIINYSYEPEKKVNGGYPEAFYLSLCILLIQAVINMKLFVDDRRNSIIGRMSVIGVSTFQYLCSMIIFNWIIMLIPYGLSNVVFNRIFFESDIVMDVKILFICMLTTAFFSIIAMAICVLATDNSSTIMIGNIVACFTAILSGMFGTIKSKGMIIVSDIMPQKLCYLWVKKVFLQDNIINSFFIKICVGCFFVLILSNVIYRKNNLYN